MVNNVLPDFANILETYNSFWPRAVCWRYMHNKHICMIGQKMKLFDQFKTQNFFLINLSFPPELFQF